ncbi:AMO-like protein, partial [Mya arenaria]
CFVVLLLVAVFALAIALGVVASRLRDQPDSCPTSSNIALDPPDNLPPFYDLTHSEIQAVKRFLYGQKELNLVKPSVITLNSSYIFSFELLPPIKQEALDYLDNGNSQPVREARVVIFRGDSKVPVSEEYTVGPTANPTYMKDKGTFPFRYRPLTGPETVAAITLLHAEIGGKANAILLESYGGKLGDCSNNCLGFEMITPMSSSASGEPMNRKMWYWLAPTVEFWSLNSLDFVVRVDLTSSDPDQYYIDRIFHAGRMFRSVDELVQAYNANTFAKTRTKMVRKQIKNEASAAVNYNLSTPKYLTFYNDKVKTRAGSPRAYRLLMKGMSKQMVTPGTGQEPSVSWARHQLAVTRYKDSERRSSSIYACYDGENPDQVAWVTMGVHHIPHMEDQPVTPTVGLDLRFFLLPYNYFDEDPAIGSGDAIRVEPRDQNDLNAGLRVERYGRKENAQCMPQKSAFDEELENKPESLFDKPTGDFTI